MLSPLKRPINRLNRTKYLYIATHPGPTHLFKVKKQSPDPPACRSMAKPTLPQSVTEKSPFGSPGWQVRHPTEKIMVAGIRKSRTKTCNRVYAEP